MARAIANSGTAAWVSGTTYDITVTLSANARRVLLVHPMVTSASVTFTSVVLDPGGADEATMTLVTDGSQAASLRQGNTLDEVYELREANLPAAGNYTVRVTLSSASIPGAEVGYEQWDDVNQTTPHRNVFVAGATSDNAPTVSVTDSEAGDAVADFLAATFPAGRTFTVDASQTQVYNFDNSGTGRFVCASTEAVPSTATTVMSWTASAGGGSRNWATIAFALIEDTGGAAPAEIPSVTMAPYQAV